MRFSTLALTARFEKSYAALENRVQKRVDKALKLLREDSTYPGLQFKPILPAKYYYEARVNRAYRLVVRPHGEKAYLIDVVDHDELGRWG